MPTSASSHHSGYEKRKPRDFVAKLLAQRIVGASHVHAHHVARFPLGKDGDVVALHCDGVEARGVVEPVDHLQVQQHGEELEGLLERASLGALDHRRGLVRDRVVSDQRVELLHRQLLGLEEGGAGEEEFSLEGDRCGRRALAHRLVLELTLHLVGLADGGDGELHAHVCRGSGRQRLQVLGGKGGADVHAGRDVDRDRLEGVAADVGDGDDDRDRGDLGGRVHGGLGCVGSLDERVARERARLDLGRRAILLLLVLLRVLLVALG
mmetsp:Transcript_6512/g.9901  ORF Transcript_6512/g.9901 Transcript_6512/m.9901 type:complete len:266 (-) Transcript_6512:781-1578(-)